MIKFTIKILTGLFLIAVWKLVPSGENFVLGFIGASIVDIWYRNN